MTKKKPRGLTAVQLAAHDLGVGGSEALAYSGADPNCTPLQLYLRKIGEAGERPPDDPRQEWGKRLEPVVREWLAEKLGRRIIAPKRTYISREHPFMFGHIDGVSKREGIEIKTGDKYTTHQFGEVGSDEVPIRYVLQVTHYMIVTGYRRFHLGALLGGNDARHYVIDYDAELAELLIERARAFWERVRTRSPPDPITLHDADKRWPRSQEKAVVANTDVLLALDMVRKLRAEEKAACEVADAAELTLKAFMGEAAVLTDPEGKRLASWQSQSRGSFDEKAFAAAHPDLAAQYRRVSSYRVFRVRRPAQPRLTAAQRAAQEVITNEVNQ
jgi:putative phage-type endonuclease